MKRLQKSYLRVAEQLARVRDERLWAEMMGRFLARFNLMGWQVTASIGVGVAIGIGIGLSP